MLHHPCILGDPRRQARGAIQKWSPTKGSKIRSGCLTPTFSGAQKRVEMLRHPCILEGPQCQARGAKSEVVPNKGEQNHNWLPHPYLLGGPKEGGNATSPLHSRGQPTKGNNIRSGCLAPALSGSPKRAQMLRHPRILGGPQRQAQGAKSEVAVSPLPSRGPKRGRKCYITLAFLMIPSAKRGEQNQTWSPTRGKKIRSGCLAPAFLGAQKRAEMLRHPCILGDPQRQARGAKIQKWSPTKGTKITSGCLTPTFSGAQKRVEMLRHPCILEGPQCQARGAKSEVVPNKGEQNHRRLPHPYVLGGPKEGRNATSPLHSRGSPRPSAGRPKSEVVPNKGEQNQKWLPHPYLLGGP